MSIQYISKKYQPHGNDCEQLCCSPTIFWIKENGSKYTKRTKFCNETGFGIMHVIFLHPPSTIVTILTSTAVMSFPKDTINEIKFYYIRECFILFSLYVHPEKSSSSKFDSLSLRLSMPYTTFVQWPWPAGHIKFDRTNIAPQ